MSAALYTLDCGRALTLAEAPDLRSRLCEALQPHRACLVDTQHLSRIDTAGMQLLLAFARDAGAAGSVVVWSRPGAALLEVAELLGITLSDEGAPSLGHVAARAVDETRPGWADIAHGLDIITALLDRDAPLEGSRLSVSIDVMRAIGERAAALGLDDLDALMRQLILMADAGEPAETPFAELLSQAVDELSARITAPPRAPSPPPSTGGDRIALRPAPGAFVQGQDPLEQLRAVSALGVSGMVTDASVLPPLPEMDPSVCYLCWSMTLPASTDAEVHARIRAVLQGSQPVPNPARRNGHYLVVRVAATLYAIPLDRVVQVDAWQADSDEANPLVDLRRQAGVAVDGDALTPVVRVETAHAGTALTLVVDAVLDVHQATDRDDADEQAGTVPATVMLLTEAGSRSAQLLDVDRLALAV